MSSIREGALKDGSTHSLAFRVMRLCRPSLQVDLPLKCDTADIWYGEDDVHAPTLMSDADDLFASRCELSEPLDALGVNGMMVLPQAFGSIYLGETFCSYISVNNHAKLSVSHVLVKAELQTERQRVVLADNTKTPIETLKAGGRHDFIIEHDIKELGAHTLVCSATYVDHNGDQKYLPQYFKFMASNPLSVRTKVRTVKAGMQDSTFLEASIENSTKVPMFLDHVRFDPAPSWQATTLEGEDDKKDAADGPLSNILKRVNLIGANGGTRHYLYNLGKVQQDETAPKAEGSNTLGKLEIMWRTTLGEPGRLQTQQILGNPVSRKEVELRLVELPKRIVLERPFLVHCRLENCTDRTVGPLRITMARDDGQGAPKAVIVSGLWALMVPGLKPHSSSDFSLSLVALASGVQRITGIGVQDVRDGKPYDTLPATEVFVEPQ